MTGLRSLIKHPLRPITRAIVRSLTKDPSGPFDLATLFDNGESGFLLSDLPYFVDVDGETEATWGDPVGLIRDASPNRADFTQPTVTARPILRNDPPRLEFDLTDDNLTTTLPAIENGTVVIAGTNGIWIDDDYNFDGGSFSIGPTTYTNGPANILTIVGDPIVGGSLVINRQLSQQERELVISKLKSMGAGDEVNYIRIMWSDLAVWNDSEIWTDINFQED